MKYLVAVNGKPARETNGEAVDEATMKVAVIDIQLSWMSYHNIIDVAVIKGAFRIIFMGSYMGTHLGVIEVVEVP